MTERSSDASAAETPVGESAVGAPAGARVRWIILAALALGAMMDAWDGTAVAVANPSIAGELNTTLTELQWVTNGYMLATAVFLITAGKIGDRFGHKRVFLVGVAGFMASSVLVGFAGHISLLIAFRVLQGLFGALLLPNSLAILTATFPPDKVKSAFGIFMGTFAVAGASGPFVGGLLVQYLDWRWVFFVNVALGACAFAVAAKLVPGTAPSGPARPFDLPGVLLLTIALGGLVLGVIQVPEHGWTGAYPLSCLSVGVAGAILFVVRETRIKLPFFPLSLFRSAAITASTVATLVAGGLMFSCWFFLALYLQEVRGLSPLLAGLELLPVNVVFLAASPVGGMLNQRFGPRLPILSGLVLVAVALFGLSQLSADSSYNAIWPFLVPLSMGVSFLAPTASQVIVGRSPAELTGVASGLGQTALIGGSVLSIAVLGTLVLFRTGSTFSANLAGAGVPSQVADQLSGSAASVAQGSITVPPDVPQHFAPAIVQAAHTSFMDGFGLAFLVAGILVLLVVPLGFLVRSEDPPARPEAAA
ncbi:DHA2 family efflux MFS transporter permease subunit [Amycolatopsis silviterrae]|uniref:DHA2 family efflux MFS transporter permease subunit n=1 Tax=Amycolatopsis silviterrae TaxID=1656914 RepID=A0ABW5HHU2_9PSEU